MRPILAVRRSWRSPATGLGAAAAPRVVARHRPTTPPRAIPEPTATLRSAAVSDAAAIWRIVRDSGTLDVNSPYAYLLLCLHHAETCVVAEVGDEPVGFVLAYRPPGRPDTVFVWQVAVAPEHRRRGMAVDLLDALLDRTADAGVRYLEATVTPSNEPSRRLFSGVAARRRAEITIAPLFDTDHFPEAGHEEEHLFRIGPL